MSTEVFIYDAVRTPRGAGQKCGPLQEIKPIQLLSSIIRTLVDRHEDLSDHIGDLMVGCMTPAGEQGGNIARAAALFSGLPYSVAGLQVNRFCASGLEAIQLGAAKIMAGWQDMIISGGLESMSRVPEASDGGPMMFDPHVRATINYIPRNISADLLATLMGYSREELDAYALQTHQRALKAQEDKLLRGSVVPVYDISHLPILEKNECLRHGINADWLAGLSPQLTAEETRGYDTMATLRYPNFLKLEHLHTEGNSAPLADGAALLLLGNRKIGERLGLRARAKIRTACVVGVEPTLMLQGAATAAQRALKQAGLKKQDIDFWETNELFAAAGLHFLKEMKLSSKNVNLFGGDIAWGYAPGALGAFSLGTLLDVLENKDAQVGGVALNARGGMASAMIVERIG